MEFIPMPEEIRQQMERNRMVSEDIVHRVTGFVYSSLDIDGLVALSNLLDAIATGGGKRMAIYWQGQADGLLRDRHNVCPVHGVNHEAEMIQAFTGKFEGSTETGDTKPPTSDDGDATPKKAPWSGDQMNEYGLYVDSEFALRCIKCNSSYVSLEDRMLKGPDDCHFCQAREGQG